MKKMMKSKNTAMKPLLIGMLLTLLLSVSLTGCVDSGANDDSNLTDGVAATSLKVEYSAEDMDSSWNSHTATAISSSDSGLEVEGEGATVVSGTKVVQITKAGTYAISGTLSGGQLIVEAGKDDLVRIVLNGVAITGDAEPAISVVSCDKTVLILAEGTTNTVTDGAAVDTNESALDTIESNEALDAAIYSEKDLTITGSGTLEVHGLLGNGIETKDDLVITDGKVIVDAANDCLRGRDSIAIKNGTFILTAEGDGLQSNNDEDKEKGWISIDGGTFRINASDAGMKAETLLQVIDGKISISSEYDSFHSNTNMYIKSGTLELIAGDDALHADSLLNIDGGTIKISDCYEGLESTEINVSDGKITITAQDDGLNAAGGSDGSSQEMGAPQQDNFAADENCKINISGGSLSVTSGGDGIDSNGSIAFSGGTVLVSGPTSNGDAPMDYNGTCLLTGGTLAIAGSSGMAQSPSDTSSQVSITVFFDNSMTAGTNISLKDSNGVEILSYEPGKNFSSIVLSSPKMNLSDTYTLYADSSKLTTVTPVKTVTAISSDGSAVQNTGQPQGGLPQGGQPQGGAEQPDGATGATPDN